MNDNDNGIIGIVKEAYVLPEPYDEGEESDWSELFLDDGGMGLQTPCPKLTDPQALIGKLVICWYPGPDDDDRMGLDEVRVEDNTVHFLKHILGDTGFEIDFQTRSLPLDILAYLDVQVLPGVGS